MSSQAQALVAHTATKIPAGARGRVLVCGSHGGGYAGYLAARAGVAAVVLNDAGVGLDNAGIGALPWCDALGMAAATVAHTSARIGDASDTLERGIVSYCNDTATRAGVRVGTSCAEAIAPLARAPVPSVAVASWEEARIDSGENRHGLRIVCVDSISLVTDADAGQIVMSGSHGGVVSGQRSLAIRVPAAAAFYNDAGIGKDDAGVGRLPVLDEQGIAAATVAAASARIGDGRSTLEDGVLSRVNATGLAMGMAVGMAAREAAERVRAGGI